jgi:hypothetical protein
MDEGAQQPYLGNDLFLQNALKGFRPLMRANYRLDPYKLDAYFFNAPRN